LTPWTRTRGRTIIGAATGCSDPFDSLDSGRWSIGDHQLGRGRLDPANVAVAGGTPSPGATLVHRLDLTS
jgi:hypothetical protein